MIDKLVQTINQYMSEASEELLDSFLEEVDHTSVDGELVSQDTMLMIEKIKIQNYFANIYATTVKSKDFDLVDKLIYDYERMVENAFADQSVEEVSVLEYMTVVINLLMGMEVSYSMKLHKMIESNNLPMLINYFQEASMQGHISGSDLYEYIVTTFDLYNSRGDDGINKVNDSPIRRKK